MKKDELPRFYFHYRPGSDMSAEEILYWISLQLDTVPDRTKYRWRVWLSEMAYGMVKERFWPHIELIGYNEWIKIPSPVHSNWHLRLKIAGTDGDIEDIDGSKIIDKVTITLEVDDGSIPGMA